MTGKFGDQNLIEHLRARAAERLAAELAEGFVTRTCPECGHRHTANGCTGSPTPSDLWAGVSPSACDCDEPDDEPPFYDSGYVAHIEDYPHPTWKARP